MRRLFLSLGLCLIVFNVHAQQRVDRALAALPEDLREGARVVNLLESGEHVVLKEGDNGITCRVPLVTEDYMVRCYPDSDEQTFDRLDSYVFRSGMGWLEAKDQIIEEIRDGDLKAPVTGATHFMMSGADFDSAEILSLVFLPMKLIRDLGIGIERDDNRPYFMWEGTELAHVMIHGELK